MGADGRLEQAGDPGPDRAGERAGDDREEDVHEAGQAGQRRADPDGHDRADEVLALAADVEHPAAERERDREPGADERDAGDQRLLQVDRRERLEVVHVPREPDVASVNGMPSSYEPTWKNQLKPAPSKIAL